MGKRSAGMNLCHFPSFSVSTCQFYVNMRTWPNSTYFAAYFVLLQSEYFLKLPRKTDMFSFFPVWNGLPRDLCSTHILHCFQEYSEKSTQHNSIFILHSDKNLTRQKPRSGQIFSKNHYPVTGMITHNSHRLLC